ncbi:MAG: hypothetical protein RI101_09325 [Nitrospira sp.]|jgi:hypothetical protein|nr:hypothetical protein [Nitrospira sp.]
MATIEDLSSRVLKIVRHTSGCAVDELAAQCSDVTWNQVFLALDRLSRSGQIVLRQQGPGHYRVTALAEQPSNQPQVSHYS